MASITIQYNNIATFSTVNFPSGVMRVNANNNKLVNTLGLPENVSELHVTDNFSLALINTHNNLAFLRAENCNLGKITVVPPNLLTLLLPFNNITTLSILSSCTRLQNLDVSFNNIKSLQFLPTTLMHFSISKNLITTINYLPTKVQELDVSSNPVSDLSYLTPDHEMRKIDLSFTNITSLANLNDRCQMIYCYENTRLFGDVPTTVLMITKMTCWQRLKMDIQDKKGPIVMPIQIDGVGILQANALLARIGYVGRKIYIDSVVFDIDMSLLTEVATITVKFVNKKDSSETVLLQKTLTDPGQYDFGLTCFPTINGTLELWGSKTSVLGVVVMNYCLFY